MNKLIVSLLPLLFLSFTPAVKTKPNIVIILTDDLGYGDLGCFGSKMIKTPHLDSLAAEGVRLTQFYSGSTVCAPSRCVLMTGKHTGNAYIRGNGEYPLRPQDLTLPKVLQQHGYATALFGKWGLGDLNTEGMPHLQGWDTFFGFLHHIEGHYQTPGIAWRKTPAMPNILRERTKPYANDAFVENALDWLQKQTSGQPFLMELALTIPHAELFAGKEAMKRYQDANGNSIFEEKPFQSSHYGGQAQPKAAYTAMVSKIDDYVGLIVKALKAKGFDQNTLIFFSSDNGTHTEGGRTLADVHLMNSSGGFRGVKRDLYEGGIRVPTLVWGLDLPGGTTRDNYGAFWDVMPTILHQAGIQNLPPTDGIDLWQYWKTGAELPNRPLYWEFYEQGFTQAVRQDDWKLIHFQPKNGAPVKELYNIALDKTESQNVINENPQQTEILDKLLVKMHAKSAIPGFLRAGE